MKNRRALGLLNPMRDKNGRQEPGGRDDTCDHVLSRSWKVEVREEKKEKKKSVQAVVSSSIMGAAVELEYQSRRTKMSM